MKSELTIYERSKDFLWTNKHIAKQMLQCHLDTTNDLASRNEKAIERTVEWITKNLPKGSSIIDFGCGPGLYTEKLYSLGYKVTGIDISILSISYAKKSAKEKNLDINYFVKSYLTDRIQGKFDAVICIYCDFGALIPDEQIQFLKTVSGCLKEKGTLFFDVFNENYSKSKKEERNWEYSDEADFWSDKPHYVLSDTKYFKDENAWGTRNILFEGKSCKEFITWDTLYDEKRIKEFLGANGFSVQEFNSTLLTEKGIDDDKVLLVKATSNS